MWNDGGGVLYSHIRDTRGGNGALFQCRHPRGARRHLGLRAHQLGGWRALQRVLAARIRRMRPRRDVRGWGRRWRSRMSGGRASQNTHPSRPPTECVYINKKEAEEALMREQMAALAREAEVMRCGCNAEIDDLTDQLQPKGKLVC